MAQFLTCFAWTMKFEDPRNEYAKVPDAPPGAFSISGINSAAWPTEFAQIEAISQAERGPAIEGFYETMFWNAWLAQLKSPDIAKRVYDAGVNMGLHTAVVTLQAAVNASGGHLEVDGSWGLNTLSLKPM